MKIWKRKIDWSTRASNSSMLRKWGARATIALTHQLHLVTNALVTNRRRWRRFVVNQSVNCVSAFSRFPWWQGHFSKPTIYHPRATIHSSLARYTPALGADHTCPIDVSLFDTRLKCAWKGSWKDSFSFFLFLFFFFSFFSPFLLRQFPHSSPSNFWISIFDRCLIRNSRNIRNEEILSNSYFRLLEILSVSIYSIPSFIVRNLNTSYTVHYSSKLFFKKQPRYWQTL